MSLVDIIFVISEKATMVNDIEWIKSILNALDTRIKENDINPQYGLVLFGVDAPELARKVLLNGSEFGDIEELYTAVDNISLDNGQQDTYYAINLAVENYTFRENAKRCSHHGYICYRHTEDDLQYTLDTIQTVLSGL